MLFLYAHVIPAHHYVFKEALNLIFHFIVNAKGIKPIEIHHRLTEVYGEQYMDVKNIRKWCREFASSHTEIQDKERSGQPSISDKTVMKVEETLNISGSLGMNSTFRFLRFPKAPSIEF